VPVDDLPDPVKADAEILWGYHNMHHEVRPCDVGIGLGSHDLGVAIHASELFHSGMFPVLVFTGANAPTTIKRFPRGEAVHFREEALRRGVPDENVLIETEARNTGQNIELSRKLLASHGHKPSSVLFISRPYQQRRAFATCQLLWPEVDIICSSRPKSLLEFLRQEESPDRIINMIVGDTQRILEYPNQGFASPQGMPDAVHHAYRRLIDAGYTSRLLATS
jgi:uncharacterized SAM-binding protein YcdF (DUF218 family)